MTRILAVIPARGGSKGVPGKNLRLLGGKHLITWTIEQALNSRGLADVVVSTDDEGIAEVSKAAGAQVPFLRPAELATDEAPTEPALIHAVEEMERNSAEYDAIMLLQPTSPIRFRETIDRAIDQFERENADSLLGVCDSHAFFWQDNPPRASYDYSNRPRRQDIEDADRRYRETGSIYITRRKRLLEERNRLCGEITLFRMAEEEGIEIDSEVDFVIAEKLIVQLGLT